MIPSNLKYVLESDPLEIEKWLEDKFTYEIPQMISTPEDMEHASVLMSAIMNSYSFVSNLAMTISVFVFNLKRECADKPADKAPEEEKKKYREKKDQYDIMALKKKILEQRQDILIREYNCLSRMITIKNNVNEELHMSDVRHV